MCDDGSIVPDDRSAALDDGCAACGNGSAARDDRYESNSPHDNRYGGLKKFERQRVHNNGRWVHGRATTGRGWATTVEIATTSRGSGDDGSDPTRTRRIHSI